MRVRTGCVIVTACLALLGCGSGDDGDSSTPPGGGFGNSPSDPTDGNDDPEEDVTPGGDEDASGSGDDEGDTVASTEDAVVVDTTSVAYVGIKGAEQAEGLFCGGESVEILVRAVDTGNRPLRLAIVKPSNTYVLPIEATSEGDDLYSFALNTLPLTIPADGLPSKDGLDPSDADDAAQIAAIDMMILEAGKSMTLQVIAYDVDEGGQEVMPTDENLMDEVTLSYDLDGPELTVGEPSPDFDLQTISGFVDMAGTLSDQGGVGYVEVVFQGEVLATFTPDADSNGKQFLYDAAVDVRREPTAFGDMTITGYDTCGHSDSVSIPVKLIAWPWLRTYPRFELPGNQSINDTTVVDWNGDGFPDVLLSTEQGIWLAKNDGVNTPQDIPVQFSSITKLVDYQSDALALVDLDNDGVNDLVSVSRLGAQGKGLLVLRNPGNSEISISTEESHVLPIGSSSQIRGIVADDFDQDGRDDVIVITSAQEESLLLYKRINNGELEADACTPVEVPDESDGAAEGAMVTVLECPTLFSPEPAISGGIEEITQVAVRDITGGSDDGPDGYPDLVLGADNVNQVFVFPNRFEQSGLLDTAFSTAEGSFVWPVSSSSLERTRHFCLGDFVVMDSDEIDDHPDIIVGGEYSGTWRTLVGKGDGGFYNEAPLNGPYADLDIYSMSGTTANEVNGIVCADFNDDSFDDFILLAGSGKTLQVHLGNGQGRYNQNPDSELLNPANEAIGFAIDRLAQRPKAADFNQDGKLDLLVDFRLGSFSVLTNLSTDERGFDLDATRVLLTPLGKTNQAGGGLLDNFAVGDVTGDGIPDVVALSENKTFTKHQWIKSFHPIAHSYRVWFDQFAADPKLTRSPTVFVWSSQLGTYGEFEPSYPSAYDRFPKGQYSGTDLHGATSALEMQLVDVANPSGGPFDPSGDGNLDIVISGQPTGGNPQSHISVYVNLAEDLWDTGLLTQASHGSFAPFNGGEKTFSTPSSFSFFTPPGYGTPGIFVASDGGVAQGLCDSLSPMIRFCPWNQYAKDDTKDPPISMPYWDCWEPLSCESTLGTKFGGQAKRVVKLSLTDGGKLDKDPSTPGDLLVVSSGGENLTLYPYNDELDYPESIPLSWPINDNLYWFFDEPVNLAVGKNPVDVAVEDIDGDGLADIVTAIDKNVMIGFGDTDNPYESFQPVDKRPGYEQTGGVARVVLSDVNADGWQDIVFTETSSSSITVYLAVGLDPLLEGDEYKRQYHGPITIPVCSKPTFIEAVDFDGDGCDTLVALCEGAGGVTVMQNDTCAKQNQ
ncbi:MAG: FG-GAP repeat domain-containing protein [Myxococcota bacterium]